MLILVNIIKKTDFGQNFKFLYKNLELGQNFRKISILVKIVGNSRF